MLRMGISDDMIEEVVTEKVSGTVKHTDRRLFGLLNKCKSGDTIFGKLRPYLKKYAFVKEDMVCSSEIWSLIPSSRIIPEYLFYLVQTDEFIRIANISSGTKMPRAEWSNVEKALFAVPGKDIQHRHSRRYVCKLLHKLAKLHLARLSLPE